MDSWQMRFMGAALVLALAGCAATVGSKVVVSEANVAKYKSLADVQVVATFEKSVNEAKAANMPFLAPNYYRDAAKVLGECQSALGNKSKEVLASNAAKGDAILEKGRAVMAIVQYRFAKELALKQRLDALNTPKLLPKEYEKVLGGLSALIDKVERELPTDNGNDKDALLNAMLALEVKAVQESALRVSELINADNRKKNADKQAPLTYVEALRVYHAARDQIAAAPHDDKLVQRLGAQALFAARHAQQVNERVAQLQTQFRVIAANGTSAAPATGSVMNSQNAAQADSKTPVAEKVTLETLVLQEEDRLLAISAALGLKDPRDQTLEKQAEQIQRAATETARRPKHEVVQDLEARLKAANEASEQALAQRAAKEQQLAAQLADKEAQLKALKEQLAQPQTAASAEAALVAPVVATPAAAPVAAPLEIPLATLATNPPPNP